MNLKELEKLLTIRVPSTGGEFKAVCVTRYTTEYIVDWIPDSYYCHDGISVDYAEDNRSTTEMLHVEAHDLICFDGVEVFSITIDQINNGTYIIINREDLY